MFETVKNRTTIRKYLPKDINPSLLNDLLETSFRAFVLISVVSANGVNSGKLCRATII